MKKKATKIIVLSVAVLATIGFRSWHKITFASSDNQSNLYSEEELVNTETAVLVTEQESGSNDVLLSLEFGEEYGKGITSFELCMQLNQSEIENVNMKWNEAFKTNQCRHTYNQTTGELRIYVVDNKDLLDNTRINIGNIGIVSNATSEFNTSLVLQELKVVGLQHMSESVMVDKTPHNIVYTPIDEPSENPPSENPPSDGPSENPPSDEPSENPPSDGPSENPPSENPPSDEPSENPPSDGPSENPPSENPPSDEPSENPPSENPPSDGPSENPPSENPPSDEPSENPPIDEPSENPPIDEPSENPPTEKPTSNPPIDEPSNNFPIEIPANNPSTEAPSSIVLVQDIQLDKTKETLEIGKTISLTAVVLPENASNNSITWSSDNEKVAKVSADGKVTAVSSGTANITVCTKDGTNIKKTVVITVKEKTVKVTSVKLSKTALTLKPKASSTLKVTISPAEATNKAVVWGSSNPKVATVKNGKITAKAVGTTTITVKTKDGSNKKATCKITVANIKLNKTKATLSKNKSISLKATVSGKSKKVTWKSSDSKIATVSKTGKVTAKKAGTATITAKANGVTATFKVKVK